MKRVEEPVRLTDDPNAPSPLAEAVRAARGPAPDQARLEALALSLGLPVSVLPPVAATAAPAAGAGMAAGAGATKLAVTGLAAATVAGAVAVVAAVGLSLAHHRPPALTTPPAAVEKLERRVPEPLENEPEIPILEPPAPSLPSAAPSPAPHRRHVTRSAPAVVVEEAPAPPVETPSDAASRLREEAALVQSAERLLAADPAGALRLTEDRRRRFPHGALDQEAEVVAIDALLRLGRRPEATTRAHAFESTHPTSLHTRRIKRLLGE